MSERRVGLWLIGAFGGVGTTVAMGMAALCRGLIDNTSLVTALPLFDGLDLDKPNQFVLGGHDVRRTGYRQAVQELHERSNLFDRGLTDSCMPDLDLWSQNVRPGTVIHTNDTIRALADLPEVQRVRSPREAIDRIQADIRAFQAKHKLDQVVVLAEKHGLHLIVSLHDYGERNLARVAETAGKIAQRYRGRTGILAFDLKNEPRFGDLRQHQRLAEFLRGLAAGCEPRARGFEPRGERGARRSATRGGR